MRVIIPRSYKQLSEQLWPKYSRHMKNLLADLNVDGYSRSLSLWWGSSSSKSSRSSSSYESPAWAGTKAFFGSVWDNTGGAVGRAYNSYSDQVGKAVDEVYDGNIATTTAKAIGKVGADNYQAYYDRKYEQTSRRIETMQQGGMDPTTAQRYGVGLAVGDVIGVTDIAEGVGGYEVENARKLSGYERTMKVVQGTGQVAGTAAGVVGATGRVSSMIAGSADDVARAGVTSRVVNGLCLAGNQIDPAPYTQANGRLNVPKPAYNNPGTHDPTSPNFNKTKSVLPDDAQAMFRKAVPDPGSLRSGINPSTGQSEVYAKNWYSKANDGSIYRFQTDEFGKAHYNGRTGDPSRAIKDADIPKGVKSRLGPAGKPPC